jgi:hypothetical protein
MDRIEIIATYKALKNEFERSDNFAADLFRLRGSTTAERLRAEARAAAARSKLLAFELTHKPYLLEA